MNQQPLLSACSSCTQQIPVHTMSSSSPKPRILIITGSSDIAEAHQFIGLAQSGFNIAMISEPDARFNAKFIEAGIKLTPLKIKGRFDYKARAVIRELITTHNPQLIHAMNNGAVANGLAASKGMKIPFIAYRGIEGNDSYWDPFTWQTYLNPRVTRVVCVADAIRRFLVKISLLGYRQPASKFVTIYKGHDLSWYQQPPGDLTEFDIPEQAFVIASVANYRPRKGIPVLIDAFDKLASHPDMHLMLIGKMDSEELQRKVAASPCRERIHLTGFRNDVPSLVSACDLYVLPSLKREGLPKTVIEAMAYAVPPIVTDSGGSPELIEQGISGLIVRSGDADDMAASIRKMYETSAEERQRMGLAAQERLRTHFHTSETVKQTKALYEELLSQ